MARPLLRTAAPVFLLSFFLTGIFARGKDYVLVSPGQKIQVKIAVTDRIRYSVSWTGREVISPSPVSMTLGGNLVLGQNPKILNSGTRSLCEKSMPAVREKRAIVTDRFNELSLNFRGDYGIIWRAYDDGVAYRFLTAMKGKIQIVGEEATFCFPENETVFFPFIKSFQTPFEAGYASVPLGDIGPGQFGFAPVVVNSRSGMKIAITESDLFDYPGMFLAGIERGRPALAGKFAPFPLEEKQTRDRTVVVAKEADYIAETAGRRAYPWRVIVIAEKDGNLIESDIVYRLARPVALKDTAWIKPGKVAWDWWNANNISGVDFKSGLNTETYLSYIDFAAKFGLEYVILDEGWSSPADLFQVNPEIDMATLLARAKDKDVGLILWCVWLTLDRQLESALDMFALWGVKGIKVDFMDRDDQKMVNFYWQTAEAAAKRHLIVDFHGAHKPTGMRRAYPNVLTTEGVMGLEYSKWSSSITPEHDLLIPFIRMLAGPMDFTPGAMRNAQEKQFRPIFNVPMSQGTRCHQLAMYVAYESPLQMLCDAPSAYMKEPEAMEFLSAVPTTWDETIVLDARIGDYLVVARKNGEDWYLGAMTDGTPRTLEIETKFLGSGAWTADIYRDGANAARFASDFKKEKKTMTAGDKIRIELAPGGGWAARIRK